MKRQLYAIALLFGATVMATKATAQCDCGTGSDGAYVASSNTTLAGGTYDYTSFTINAGVTVTVTGNQPLIIHSTGNITINGALNLNGGNGGSGITNVSYGSGGVGVAGGYNGGDGSYSGTSGQIPGNAGTGPGAGGLGTLWGGGGGAGYGTAGTDGQLIGNGGGVGGVVNGNIYLLSYDGGSGGGGGSGGFSCGSGGGGAGGGILVMYTCDTLSIGASASISSNGGNGGSDGSGNCGGGGGGAGGTIWLTATHFMNNGSVQAIGGTGGTSTYTTPGGAGAVGRIRLDYNTTSGTGTTVPAAGYTTTLLSATASYISPLCFSDSNGSASVVASGGTPGYSYLWTGGDTTTGITGIAAGSYTITVTDTNGCTASDTAIVTQPAQLNVNGTATNESTVSANDGTAAATVTGGTSPYTYLWMPGGGTTSNISSLDSGYYIVVVTDDNGCTAGDTVHVGLTTSASSLSQTGDLISIYPNPTSGFVTIDATRAVKGEITLELTDMTGKLFIAEKFNGGTPYILNTGNYAAGNYILRISCEEGTQNIPLTIVK